MSDDGDNGYRIVKSGRPYLAYCRYTFSRLDGLLV